MKNLTILTMFTLLTACSQVSSNDVDVSTVYGSMTLSQHGTNPSAILQHTFYVGGGTGTIIKIDSPASILVNDSPATQKHEHILNYDYYEASIPLSAQSAIVQYTDKEGNEYINSLRLPGTTQFSVSGAPNRQSGIPVNFQSSRPFVSNEDLYVHIESESINTTYYLRLSKGNSQGNVLVPASYLEGFSAGAIQIKVCRNVYPTADQPYPAGTQIHVESCSEAQNIQLQ